MQPTEEDNLRVLLELMQKVGMDKVHEMLNEQSPALSMEGAEGWEQNFDLAL